MAVADPVDPILKVAKSPTLRRLWAKIKKRLPAGTPPARHVQLLAKVAQRRNLWPTVVREARANGGTFPQGTLDAFPELSKAWKASAKAGGKAKAPGKAPGKAGGPAKKKDPRSGAKWHSVEEPPPTTMYLRALGDWKHVPIPGKDPGKGGKKQAPKGMLEGYLSRSPALVGHKGDGTCLRCKKKIPSQMRTDGVYVWPEGLAHYVTDHHVHLPQKFVDTVVRRGGHAPTISEKELRALAKAEVSDDWWISSMREHNPRRRATNEEGPRSGGARFVRGKTPAKAAAGKATASDREAVRERVLAQAKMRAEELREAGGGARGAARGGSSGKGATKSPSARVRRTNPVASFSEAPAFEGTVDQISEGIEVGTLEDVGLTFDENEWEPETGMYLDPRFDGTRAVADQPLVVYIPETGDFGAKRKGQRGAPSAKGRQSNPLPPAPPGTPRAPGGAPIKNPIRFEDPRTRNPLAKGRRRNPVEGAKVVVPQREYTLIAGPEKGLKYTVVVEDRAGNRTRYKILSVGGGEWAETFTGRENAVRFAKALEARVPGLLEMAAAGNFTSDLRIAIETLRANISERMTREEVGERRGENQSPPQVVVVEDEPVPAPKVPGAAATTGNQRAPVSRSTLVSAIPSAPVGNTSVYDALGPGSSPTSTRLRQGPNPSKK
jgi:hypothetical protein